MDRAESKHQVSVNELLQRKGNSHVVPGQNVNKGDLGELERLVCKTQDINVDVVGKQLHLLYDERNNWQTGLNAGILGKPRVKNTCNKVPTDDF